MNPPLGWRRSATDRLQLVLWRGRVLGGVGWWGVAADEHRVEEAAERGARRLKAHAECREYVVAGSAALPEYAEQQVLDADVRVLEGARFVLGQSERCL